MTTDVDGGRGRRRSPSPSSTGKYTLRLRSPPGADEGHVHRRAPPPPTTPPPPRPTADARRRRGSSSPSPGRPSRSTTPAGKAVKALKAGRAVITVRDRSATRGVRLSGAGVSKTTGVTFVGTATWNVKLTKGTLVYASHAAQAGAPRRGRVPGFAGRAARLEGLAAHEPHGPLGVHVVRVGEHAEDARRAGDPVVVEPLEAAPRHPARGAVARPARAAEGEDEP